MARLRKFLLSTLPSNNELPSYLLDFQDTDLVVILGGNGSGKTLFVRMLQSLLTWRGEFASTWHVEFDTAHLEVETNHGIVAIEADFQGRTRKVRTLLANGHADLKTSDLNGAGEDESDAELPLWFTLDEALLSQTFLVADGRIGVEFNQTLLTNLAEAVLQPLKLAHKHAQEERQRISVLLADGKAELDQIEERLKSFARALSQIEENKAKRQSLDEELREHAGELRKQQQQLSRLMYRKNLTERLTILISWLAEVAQERAVVEKLRERHVDLLSRFEESYVPFRGLPEDFGDSLAALVALHEKQQALSTTIEKAAEERGRKESELAAIREKRKCCEAERQNQFSSAEENRAQVLQTRARLKSLHQARLELEEKRDLKLRLLSEALGGACIRSRELLDNSRRLLELHTTRQKLAQQRESCEEKWLALYERERLQVQSCELGFPGFDNLPVAAAELLPRLFRARSELKDSERQITRMQHQLAQFRRHPHLTAAGGLAFLTALLGLGVGIVMADWALGLFLALMVSGVSLLVFGRRLAFPPRIEKRLKAELDMLRNQWKRVLDVKDESEQKLKPVLNYPDLASALRTLQNYENQKVKLQAIRNDLISCEAEAAALPSLKAIETEIATLTATLPEKLRNTVPEHVVRHAEACAQLEEDLEPILTSLAEYKPHGEKFLETAQLDAELAEVEGREAEGHPLQERYYREIENFSHAEQKLQSELEVDVFAPLLRERAELEAQFEEMLSQNAAQLGGGNLSSLWEQWQQMVNLRTELRAVRDELSAHPTLDELGCREQILKAEMNPLQAETAGAETERLPDLESLEEEISRRESEIAHMEQMKRELPVTLEETGFAIEGSPESLAAEADQRRQRLLEMQREREELEHVMARIDAEIADCTEGFPGEILNAAATLLRPLTEGRIQEIIWEPNGLSIVNAAQRTLPVEKLSGGLHDLVMFALRLAMIEKLEISELPLVFDDPFGRLDAEHLTRVRELLARFSQRNQVILLSRDPRYGTWGRTILLGGFQQSANNNVEAGNLNTGS